MPLTWKVDHDSRLTTASGALVRKDIADYLAAVVADGAVGYRVIFDARAADLALRPSDLAAFSQTVKDRKRDNVSDGRIALVVASEAEQEMGTYFVDLTDGQRPCRLFQSVEDARAWVDGLGDQTPTSTTPVLLVVHLGAAHLAVVVGDHSVERSVSRQADIGRIRSGAGASDARLEQCHYAGIT